MKKSVLFVVDSLNVGGVEKCLLTTLNHLPEDKYDLTVGVVNRTGDFLQFIPPHVRVVEINSLHRNQWRWRIDTGIVREMLKPSRLGSLFMIPWLRLVSKVRGTLIPLYSHYVNAHTDDMPEFDVAIAFQGPSQLLDYYVGRVVKARKKLGWIHFDVDRFFINPKTSAEACKDFARIFVVSDSALESFRRKVPSLSDRSETMVNLIDADEIRKSASEFDPFIHKDGVRQIVTVGRIRHQKAQDLAIKAAAILRAKGYDFHWTMVGDGCELENWRAMAATTGVADVVTFAGSKINPYPYMKHADIYVQPSRFEGFCLTVGEAKLFGVPIVATDFMGAREQLSTVENAVIVPEITPESIAEGIERAWNMPKITPAEPPVPDQIIRLMEELDS
ncbi:MAG: glycosyltransferase [Muribaculaceae bacterium]|nr:glycosyltransferase [Muribaculaceae bacterium]